MKTDLRPEESGDGRVANDVVVGEEEGLAEKTNWLGASISEDAFGKALLDAGFTEEIIKAWCVDPRVTLPGDQGQGSVFDALEDMNVDECLKKLVELNSIN